MNECERSYSYKAHMNKYMNVWKYESKTEWQYELVWMHEC